MLNSTSLTSTNIDRIYEQDAIISIGMLSNIIEEFSSFRVRFLIYFRWYLSEASHVIKLSERECENHKKSLWFPWWVAAITTKCIFHSHNDIY